MSLIGTGTLDWRTFDPSDQLRKTAKVLRSLTSNRMSLSADYLEWLAGNLESQQADKEALRDHWHNG